MKVDLIQNSGDDLLVVNAARVSFAKTSKELNGNDEKLIAYLAEHNHWTPFSHCTTTFRIKAPIFVARQFFKHKVGLTENEISRRYVDALPEFYWPDKWRKKTENKKQGSSNEEVDVSVHWRSLKEWNTVDTEPTLKQFMEQSVYQCLGAYEQALKAGICPEQARMILPQNMYTEWFWTGSLAAFARICMLRTSSDAQLETRFIAQDIWNIMEELYPVSWTYLTKKSNYIEACFGTEEERKN